MHGSDKPETSPGARFSSSRESAGASGMGNTGTPGSTYLDDFTLFRIAKHPLLADLPGYDRPMLNRLGARVKTYRKGEIICAQGERLDCIGLVLSGEIEGGFRGLKYYQMINRFKKNDTFAEAVAMNLSVSPVEIRAVTESEVLFLQVEPLLNSPNDPAICGLLSRVALEMTHKVMVLSTKLRTLRNPAVIGRVASYLLEIADPETGFAPMEFNQTELGDYLGSSRPRVSSALTCLVKDQIIRVADSGHNGYLILDWPRLEWIAENGRLDSKAGAPAPAAPGTAAPTVSTPTQEETTTMDITIEQQANVDSTQTMRTIVGAEPLFEKFLQYKGFPFSVENPITEIVTFNDVVEMMSLDKEAFLQEYVEWRASEQSY